MPNRRNAAMPSKGGNMTGDPSHHPEPALLMEYASGASPEPFSLVIATHLALCPECRRSVAELEAAGVRRISLATSLYRAAMSGLVDAAREVKDKGRFGYLDRALTTPELNALIGD